MAAALHLDPAAHLEVTHHVTSGRPSPAALTDPGSAPHRDLVDALNDILHSATPLDRAQCESPGPAAVTYIIRGTAAGNSVAISLLRRDRVLVATDADGCRSLAVPNDMLRRAHVCVGLTFADGPTR